MVVMFQEDNGTSSVASSPLQVFSTMSLTRPTLLPSPSSSPFHSLKDLKPEERGLYLIHLLLTCANHVASGSLQNANAALEQLSLLSSPDGDTMQRVAAYFTEALANRILKSWPGLYKALNATQTRTSNVSEEVHVRRERIPAALRLGDQAKSPVSQSRVPVSLRLGTSLPGVVMEPMEKEKPVKRKPGRPQEREWSQQAQLQERIPAALRLGDQAKSPVSQSRVPVSLRLGTSLPGVVMEPVEKEKPVKRKPGRPQEGEWSQQAQLQERIPAALRLGDQAKSPVSQSRVPVSLRLGTSLPGVVMEPVEKEKPVKRKPGRPQEGEWSQQAQLQ
ncbi:hypothetical protein F2Q70_00013697 [Brassica cretica]|uniref:Uncharacterized protein n=1 Tax=Brassica cretica TaxID=69181 RepID=A0A8S9LWL8_BRACR|nr:hypothetical protein F2Q70_00013697 [Brassica cretica]